MHNGRHFFEGLYICFIFLLPFEKKERMKAQILEMSQLLTNIHDLMLFVLACCLLKVNVQTKV